MVLVRRGFVDDFHIMPVKMKISVSKLFISPRVSSWEFVSDCVTTYLHLTHLGSLVTSPSQVGAGAESRVDVPAPSPAMGEEGLH